MSSKLNVFSTLDPSLQRLFKVSFKVVVTVGLTLFSFCTYQPLSFVFFILHSKELFSPSNPDPKTLAFKSLTVSAFPSDTLDPSFSFLSHFASVSLSFCLFSINPPHVLFFSSCPSRHAPSSSALYHYHTFPLCFAVATLIFLSQPVISNLFGKCVCVCVFLGMSPLH